MIHASTTYVMREQSECLGNGNCLLHAVLLAMVGIHDLNLHLRDRLKIFMDINEKSLKTHWQMQRLRSDQMYGVQSEDKELDR
ncbi:unnamed protein product, partial [Rotaria sp. Silwood1]